MRRQHLVELEDLPGRPQVIRDAGTAYLRAISRVTGQTARLMPTLARALRESGAREIVDLCSGGGGPLPDMLQGLVEQGLDVRVKLTDRFPNRGALEAATREAPDRISFEPGPVDAREVPEILQGLRTLFNGFHHFAPDDARRILADAARARQPVVVCELVQRHPVMMLGVVLSVIPVMLLVPFLRPFDWRWLIFTYLVPLIPLLVVWDGLVSCLRVYSPDELHELVESVGAKDYAWEIGRVALGPPGIPKATYLVGMPENPDPPLGPSEAR